MNFEDLFISFDDINYDDFDFTDIAAHVMSYNEDPSKVFSLNIDTTLTYDLYDYIVTEYFKEQGMNVSSVDVKKMSKIIKEAGIVLE